MLVLGRVSTVTQWVGRRTLRDNIKMIFLVFFVCLFVCLFVFLVEKFAKFLFSTLFIYELLLDR